LGKSFQPSKKGKVFADLMPLITNEDNLMLAYRMIKDNKGSKTPGVDKKTIKDIKKIGFHKFLKLIQGKLEFYEPTTVRREFIPKKNGKLRPLGIPALVDRIIQQAIKQILEPIFEAKFDDHSFGFRPGRSQENAIAQCAVLVLHGYMQIIDVDIEAFFDNMNHSTLARILWSKGIRDQKLLSIILKILKAPIEGEGIPVKGAAQGGILSPLMSNIYLNELDEWVSGQWATFPLGCPRKSKSNLKRGIIVRFADDFKIFTKTRSEAVRWFHAIAQWLNERLKLNYSKEKSGIVNLKKKSSHFLGFDLKAVKSRNTGGYFCSKRIGKAEKDKICDRIRNDWKVLAKLNCDDPKRFSHASRMEAYIRGVRNYFQIANSVYSDLADVDFRTYRVKKKILVLFPGLLPLIEKIYSRVCYHPSKVKQNANNKLTFSLCQNVKFRIPKFHLKSNKFCDDINISVFQSALNALRKKLKSWNYNYVEKADICLSLFTMQKGKDLITGEMMQIDRIHCHRKIPGTEYEFKNCILIDKLTQLLQVTGLPVKCIFQSNIVLF